jgi:hypothetical protein
VAYDVEVTGGDGNGLFDAANDNDTIRVSTALLKAAFNYSGPYTIQHTSTTANSFYGLSTSSYGIRGASTSNYAGFFSSVSGNGLYATSTTGRGIDVVIGPASTNSLATALRLQRSSSGTAANGIGVQIDYFIEDSTGTALTAGYSGMRWSDVNNSVRTASWEVGLVNLAGTAARKMLVAGTGQLTLDGYATWASFQSDTTTRIAAITPTGEVVWRAASTLAGAGTDDQNLSVGAGTATTSIIEIEDGTDVTLEAGTNITLSESGNTITIAATGGGTDDQTIDTFAIVSDVLRLSLEDDGEPFKSVDLSPYLDNTDDQKIDTISFSRDSLSLSLESDAEAKKVVRIPGNGFLRDSITGATLTIDLKKYNNAVVVVKMESATNCTLTVNNPWSVLTDNTAPTYEGQTGVYTFHFIGTSGTDNITWPAAFLDMGGTQLGTDAITAGTAYTCYYDPVGAKYYCK